MKTADDQIVMRQIEGETCPRCHGGRIYFDHRPARFGKTKEGRKDYTNLIQGETTRSCLECWHKW